MAEQKKTLWQQADAARVKANSLAQEAAEAAQAAYELELRAQEKEGDRPA